MGFEPMFVVSPIVKTYLLGLYKKLLLSDRHVAVAIYAWRGRDMGSLLQVTIQVH